MRLWRQATQSDSVDRAGTSQLQASWSALAQKRKRPSCTASARQARPSGSSADRVAGPGR